MKPPVVIPLRRPGDAAARADRDGAEGAGRDRRQADPLARDRDLRGAGIRALPARHRLPGRGGGGVRGGRVVAERRLGRVRRHGLDTPTGGRIARPCRSSRGGTFCATYADGVADIDLGALLDFHAGHGDLATMTVVRPHLQWGVAELGEGDGSRASSRSRAASTGSTAASSASSRAPSTISTSRACSSASRSRRLAADGQLRAHRHEGFWDCMDTYKDAVVLNDLWAAGEAPWRALAEVGAR